MGIGVGQVSWSADGINFCFLLVYSLENAGVQDRSFGSRVDSHEKNGISIFNHFNLGVEEEIGSEVVGDGKVGSLPEIIVETIEGIQEIFQSLDILNALELANATGDVFAVNFINSRCDHGHDIFPTLLSKISSFSQKRYS